MIDPKQIEKATKFKEKNPKRNKRTKSDSNLLNLVVQKNKLLSDKKKSETDRSERIKKRDDIKKQDLLPDEDD